MASVERPDLTGSDADKVLARLYDEHARGLHRYLARRLDPATADDLVGDTFLLAWEQRDRNLGTALAKLRQEERDVLLLVAWAGLKPSEVAEALDIDAGTVRSRLHRARSALRDHLGAER